MHDLTIVLSSNNKFGILAYLKEVPPETLKSDLEAAEAELLRIEDAKSVLASLKGARENYYERQRLAHERKMAKAF